jgi:acetyl esterase
MCATPVFASPLQRVGAHEVLEDDFVYARAAGVELKAHSYRPKGVVKPHAVIDIHGGAWSSGDRMGGKVYGQALASSGLYVFAIDFRQAPAFQHPSASQDVVAAIHYLRAHAQRLDIDTSRLGLVGSSSGGHLAMLTGIMPNAAQFAGTAIVTASGAFETPADKVEPLAYIIALWAVSNPAFRYEFAKRSGRDDLIKSHDAYYGTTARMLEASVPRALRAGEAEHLPPLLFVQPGNDANIPREMTFDLVAAYQDGGGQVDYAFYPGQPHAFGHRPSQATNELIGTMRDFIGRTVAGE